jgi:hypothetical protein
MNIKLSQNKLNPLVNATLWVAIPVLIVASPIVHAFGNLSLPLLTSSGTKIVGFATLFAAVMGFLSWRIHENLKSNLQWFFQFSFLVSVSMLSAELTGVLQFLYQTILESGLAKVVAVVSAFSVVAAASALISIFVLRDLEKRAVLLTLFFGIMLILSIDFIGETWGQKRLAPLVDGVSEQPAIVHIVLDEMIGVEGIPNDIQGGSELKARVKDVFTKHGFRIYSKAYSRHFMTGMSIPNTLNYDFTDKTYGTISKYQRPDNFRVNQKNLHFEKLQNSRYALNIYQTEFFDFCQAVVIQRCNTYASYNPWNSFIVQNAEIDREKATAQNLQNASLGSRLLHGYFGLFAHSKSSSAGDSIPTHFELYAVNKWINEIGLNIIDEPRGTMHFAHILAPHGPYILDHNCVVTNKWGSLPQFMREDRNLTEAGFETERVAQYINYFKQATCVINLMDQLLDSIAATPQLQDATIIIHGDHGSRLSAGRFIETLSERDYTDNYSTLFVLRAPNVEVGIESRIVSVQQLISEIFNADHVSKLKAPTVSVESRQDAVVKEVAIPPL